MAKELKKAYSNLGLPEEVLNSVAGMVIIGLPEDADDAAIAARASESSVSEMLKSFQSHTDKIRTDVKKATLQDNKGGGSTVTTTTNNDVPDYIKAVLEEQKKTNDLLTKKIADLESANTKRTFDEMVSSIGKELGLTGALLDLCKAGLSSDSDEKGVRDHLGKVKKTLIDSGAKIDEVTKSNVSTADEDEKLRKEAEEWVKRQADAKKDE